MLLESQILSEVTTFLKYAKFLPEKQRRETWEELVDRNKNMHIERYPHLTDEIEAAYQFVYDKKVLPSMRSLQFAGKPIDLNNARLYNCCFLPMDHPDAFSEIMFLLLSGTGVGYSVQSQHVEKLPAINKPTRTRRYLVGDSIEGWADAVKVLVSAYMRGKAMPVFDFRDIRPKGAMLITSGGKAPGPEPLKDALHNIQKIFDRKQNGEQLTTLEVHDINCFIADAVLSGGIRRSAMISLFDLDDEEMLTCKFGNWWETNAQRGRSNNSAVIVRHKIEKEVFLDLWKKIEASNSGEPGFFFTNDAAWGLNPCAEISLRPFQFCNLTTIHAGTLEDQEDFNARAKAAAFIGTLQASYTNFHYLRDIWKRTTEKEALLGVSMTGIASGAVLTLDMRQAASVVKAENERVAALLGIKKAARTTTVKPEGTSSLVLGTSSGIHAWHNDFYVRRIRVGKNEGIYDYLVANHPEIVEDEFFKPTQQAVISIPQRAPEGAVTRQESALDLLGRVSTVWREWVKAGHRKGENMNNVSTTITIKPTEWEEVGEWMWSNRDSFTALSVLPEDLGSYIQAPFEDITKEEYEDLVSHLHAIDLTQVLETEDRTDLQGEVACGGAVGCEVQ
jgi:ribonucleoside-triphosphate reductase (thioredoxin)